MEYRERREPLGLSDLLLVYHDFLLALSRRTERLMQDFCACAKKQKKVAVDGRTFHS